MHASDSILIHQEATRDLVVVPGRLLGILVLRLQVHVHDGALGTGYWDLELGGEGLDNVFGGIAILLVTFRVLNGLVQVVLSCAVWHAEINCYVA